MDPVTASIATGLAVKVFDSAVDKGIDAAMDEVGQAGRRVVEWLRSRFAGRKELEAFGDSPDSARRAQAFQGVVETELVEDPAAASELERLVEALKADEPSVYQEARGHGNVLISGSHNTVTTNVVNNAPRPVGVRWTVTPSSGSSYIVQNVGDETAYDPRAEADRPAVEGPLFAGTVPEMEPGDRSRFVIFQPWSGGVDEICLTWNEGARSGQRRLKTLLLE